MPKPLRWIVYLVVALSALSAVLFIGGLMLPSHLELRVQHTISAPAKAIFDHVDSHAGIRAWWRPIALKQGEHGKPSFTIEPLPGPAKGHSMRVAFAAADERFETWTCIASEPPRRIEFDVDFGAFRSRRTLAFKPADGGATTVTWHETADVDGVLMRWILTLGTDAAKALRVDALKELGAVVAATKNNPNAAKSANGEYP